MVKDFIPENICDKVHFYGTIETPNDTIKFFCNTYSIIGNIITIYGLLLDVTATRKAPFLVKDQLYYEKLEITGYMAAFTPYVPYKLRKETENIGLFKNKT